MFILTRFRDVVKISPDKFKFNLNDEIAKELNRKLANQVFLNIGLCITLYDIEKIEDSFIFPGDGSSHTKVVFRYVVFKPFKEEILVGKIRSCSKDDGVTVSLGFFEDIIIPPEKLPNPSRFDAEELTWVWEYSNPEDGSKHDFFMDIGEQIQFRVYDSIFEETFSDERVTSESTQKTEKKVSPYVLEGAINEPGLGLLSWWT